MSQNHFYVTGIALSQFVLGAEALGINARAVLSHCGLNEQHLAPTSKVPESQYEMVLLQLSLASHNDCLGADIGQQLMPSLYGVLTSMLLNSPSIAEGLKNFVDYQALATGNCGGIESAVTDSGAEYTMAMTHQNPVARRLVTECVITLLCNLLKLMSGNQALAPKSISLEHTASSERAKLYFESLVNCPVIWGDRSSSLLIDSDTHQKPLHGHGDEMLKMARQLADKQLESIEKRSSSVEAIKWHTRELMLSGTPRREVVASRLSISPSTLDRRLKEAQLSWQEMVDGLRAQLSADYLSDRTLSIADIADKLGFSDTRAFQRRFKRWTGMTPSEFRKNEQV